MSCLLPLFYIMSSATYCNLLITKYTMYMNVLQMVISLLCLISSDIHELINYATFFETMFIGLTVAALLYMRKKYPDLARPLKVGIY